MCHSISIASRTAAVAATALITLAGCRSSVFPHTERPSSVIAITHVAVADATSEQPRNDMTIVVRDGTIVSVGPAGQASLPADAHVVDGRGKYVIPGLWDMHIHVSYDGAWGLSEYISHGITSVRDMGTEVELIDSVRGAMTRGTLVGPRIFAAGPMIESPDAMRDILAGRTADDSARARRAYLVLATPEAATRAVDSLGRLGVHFIKGRDFTDVATYWAVANAARRIGLPFVGHAPFGLAVDPIALADSGQRGMEHWYFPGDLMTMPKPRHDSIVAAYIRNGIVLDPTIMAWRQHRFTVDSLERMLSMAERDPRAAHLPASTWNSWRKDLASRRTEQDGRPATQAELRGWNRALDGYARDVGKLANAGLLIVAGSDLPFARFPGEALGDELVMLVREAGLTPRQALESATLAPARALKMQDAVGTVAPGKRADLVVLDANPLADIGNVRRVSAVMREGQWRWRLQ